MKIFITLYCIGLSVYWAAGQTPNRNQDEWYKEQWPTQPYAFGYEIRDYSGNEQYRKEMSDGERVTGSYGYLGPDGLYRHVEYVADENGFRAKIRTSEPGTANDNPSNVQIESNPVQVVSNPTPYAGPPSAPPGSAYNNPIGGGVRREDTIRPQNIPTVNVNPNRSTYGTRQLDQLPRTPEPSRAPNPAPDVNRDRVNMNRGPDSSRPVNPIYESNVRDGSTGDNRGGRVGDRDRVPYADIPDNIMPYRGANPQRPKETPRVVPQNEFIDQNVPKFGSNPDINDQRNPGYSRNGVNPRLPEPQSFIGPTDPPYETNFDRSGRDRDRDMNPIFDDNRDPPIGGYEVTTKGGSTKGPPKTYGFIEATKDPINAIKPINKFYDKRPSGVFYEDNRDQYDDFSRRQDRDQRVPVINKPVFEGKETPQKVGVFVRSKYNSTAPEIKGVKGMGGAPTQPIPPIRDTFNRTLNVSSFDANQGRRDGFDKRVRRPTKVFVTSGPISGFDDNRPQVKGDDRSFGAIDAQQRQQHIDVDYDDKNTRDGQPIGLNGIKGYTDRDRPQPPRDLQGIQIPPQSLDIRPYYGARHQTKGRDRSQEPQQRPHITVRPVVPPYDPRLEQNIQTSDEELPEQRDDEFPIDQQQVRPQRPQVYQPLRPNGRPDRQPSPPRKLDRPYKPRTQSQDRAFVEQQHIEVQPYQTQSSATISSPVNTIPNVYKPIDSLDDNKKSDENDVNNDKPNLNTPLSPSSYVVTPFPAPVNQSIIHIKPIIDEGRDGGVYTVAPQLTQMEIPRFGTRLRTPEPPLEEMYEPIDELIEDHKVDQIKEFIDHHKEYNNNPNDYSIDNQDIRTDSPTANPNDNPLAQPLVFENIDDDQYYAYEDEEESGTQNEAQSGAHNVEIVEKPKNLIYTQTISQSHRSDEKVDISAKSNSSSPIEISHKVMNVLNWHKYDQMEGTGS